MSKPANSQSAGSNKANDESMRRRKEEMLPYLQQQMRNHHQRKQWLRHCATSASVAAGIVLVGAFIWHSTVGGLNSIEQPGELVRHRPVGDSQTELIADSAPIRSSPWVATNSERVKAKFVRDNRSVAPRASIHSTEDRSPEIQLGEIDDQQLLMLLAELGRPSVLAEVNGSKIVVASN